MAPSPTPSWKTERKPAHAKFWPGDKNHIMQVILKGLPEWRFLQLLQDLRVGLGAGTAFAGRVVILALIMLLRIVRLKRWGPRPWGELQPWGETEQRAQSPPEHTHTHTLRSEVHLECHSLGHSHSPSLGTLGKHSLTSHVSRPFLTETWLHYVIQSDTELTLYPRLTWFLILAFSSSQRVKL